jgi:hypothetical protein
MSLCRVSFCKLFYAYCHSDEDIFAQCHYDGFSPAKHYTLECHYTICHSSECHSAICCSIPCHSVECHNTKGHSSLCCSSLSAVLLRVFSLKVVLASTILLMVIFVSVFARCRVILLNVVAPFPSVKIPPSKQSLGLVNVESLFHQFI